MKIEDSQFQNWLLDPMNKIQVINFLTFLAMESLSSLNPLLGFKITSICEGVKWDMAAHGYLAHFLSCMASVKARIYGYNT